MREPLQRPVGPVPVPSLGEVLADAAILGRLPLEALIGLRRQVRHLDADVDAALARRLALGADRSEPIEVVGVEEAAKLLDTSTDSLYRKHKRFRLGYIDTLDGRLKFSKQEINEHIRRQRRG